jgi:hypothetical protein
MSNILFKIELKYERYDQVMFEDPTQNRMKESLNLFTQVSANFVHTGVGVLWCGWWHSASVGWGE